MRWIKHMTTAAEDEVIQMLLDTFGAAGYGVYWLVNERIGMQMEGHSEKHSVTYSVKKWCEICHVKRAELIKIAAFWSEIRQKPEQIGKVCFEFHENMLTVSYRNLLKYRDEYASKIRRVSRQHPESVRKEQIRSDTDQNRSEADADRACARGGGGNGNGSSKPAGSQPQPWSCPEDLKAELRGNHPGLDIDREILDAAEWLSTEKPGRRPTTKFIRDWVARTAKRQAEEAAETPALPVVPAATDKVFDW